MCFIVDESICSDLNEIKGFLQDILNQLEKNIDDETLLFDTKLILHELVANGAIHGNSKDCSKNIKIRLELKNNRLQIEVTDEGMGFCFDEGAYDPMELKCNGRGLVLVNGLSDEFYVDKNKAVSIKYI
ncbi:ATP-binding protein [Sporosalibacterium faouarense]|uniref:ATP-binding protein n=1 Tax=Sporosalibacterium faouarense TaxID=516123 RepID=UPI00141D034B|nr:ATP-binding protein [Sporosalibacterium faouarense]MTI46607.1 ATP-binding protein [Bacillota bacterium]